MRLRKIQNPGMFFIAISLVAGVPAELVDWLVPNACTRVLGPFTDCPPSVPAMIGLCLIDYVLTALIFYFIGADKWTWPDLSRFIFRK